ncbi:MAG: GGDEF domain-containing protein [Pseudomonadota bacterium]
MASAVDDDDPRSSAEKTDLTSDLNPIANPLVKAGFEAGLSVIVDAFPTACAVVDMSGRVVASNRAADAFVASLDMSDLPAEIETAMAKARHVRSTVSTDYVLSKGDVTRFHIRSLNGTNGVDMALFLITQDQGNQARIESDPNVPFWDQQTEPSPIQFLREEAARFKHLSEIDPLTGAMNVRAFAASVSQALTDASRCRGAMICLDLNRFKSINDKFGHVAGDRVLTHVAAKLSFPTLTGILTARLGGDEFALWMPDVSPDSLQAVILVLRERLRVPVKLSEDSDHTRQVRVKASIGAACCPDEALNYTSLRYLADQRLYEDKARFGLGRLRKAATKRKGAVDPAPQSFLPR